MESLDGFGVFHRARGQDFDGGLAFQSAVIRFEDLAHPAGPNFGLDHVGAEPEYARPPAKNCAALKVGEQIPFDEPLCQIARRSKLLGLGMQFIKLSLRHQLIRPECLKKLFGRKLAL